MDSKNVAMGIIDLHLRKINKRARVALTLDSVACYATVKNGRGPRDVRGAVTDRLPIIGSHDVSRLGDELDRERAELVVVFTISGTINSVEYSDVTIWIQGNQVSLPTLFSGTKNAQDVLYELGRTIRDSVIDMPNLMDQAWEDHVNGVIAKVAEMRRYLDDVTAAAKRQLGPTGVTIGMTARRSR